MDIHWGYNNIRLAEGDEQKAAFITNRGLFEPLVMFFGLTNSPATFQMMMNSIFRNLILEGKVIVYLDNILIFTNDLDDHRRITRQVLEILREHNLTCKPEKCEFKKSEVEYLGHIISHNSVRIDPAKVAGITDWPTPKNKRELQQFLGFANFYRRFVKDYSKHAVPITKLTGQVEWNWGPEQTTAFDAIKKAITTTPAIAIANDNNPFRVQCNSSNYAISAELAQKQDGSWKTIAFLSKALSPAERNYEIYDKELLAIMMSLDEWRHFLMGARQKFKVYSDHKNLGYFCKPQKLNPRQVRWVLELQNYDFSLLHKPGKLQIHGDPLSRHPDHDKGTTNNEDIVLLKPQWFSAIMIDGSDQIINKINKITTYDKSVVSKLSSEDFTKTEDSLIYRRGRIVVPIDTTLRGSIIQAHHDSVAAGHPGQSKTQELIYQSYWWPTIKKDVQKYVKGCEICQRSKIDHQPHKTPLHPNPIPDQNWQYVSADMITHLPEAQGFNAIINFVCMKSKNIISVKCRDDIDSEGQIKLYIDNIFRLHGLFERFFSDRRTIFISSFVKGVFEKLGIRANPSTAYHPQTDGQSEHMHQEIQNYLRIFCNH